MLARVVAPTAYLARLRDVLRSTEPELWEFFASAPRIDALVQEVRGHLLRSAYRLDDGAHEPVLQLAATAADRLGVREPVTLYQAQSGTAAQGNAAVHSLPGEVHVVLSGALLELLDPDEQLAVLGHELAHHVLWSADGGDFWVLDRLVHASAEDIEALPPHEETARRLRLHTELVADRGALLAVDGRVEVAVAALVKLDTGLREVSGAAYLRQAQEVLDAGGPATAASSHPEGHLRAWALAAWADAGARAEPEIAARLAGPVELDRLDVVGQHDLTELSQRLVRSFLEPEWARTDALLGHARHFGEPALPSGSSPGRAVTAADLAGLGGSVEDYVVHLLLDLATVDEAAEEPALAAAFLLSAELGLDERFDAAVGSELGLGVREVRSRRRSAASVLAGRAAS